MTSQWDTGDEEWICRAALCGEKTDFHISFKLDLVIVVPSRRRMPVRQLELKAWRDHFKFKNKSSSPQCDRGRTMFSPVRDPSCVRVRTGHDLRVAEFCVWLLQTSFEVHRSYKALTTTPYASRHVQSASNSAHVSISKIAELSL
jgi:hypothetical protein